MGAYKYLEELWKKKQSDALRFLLRVRNNNNKKSGIQLRQTRGQWHKERRTLLSK